MTERAYKKFKTIILVLSFVATICSIISNRNNGYTFVFFVPLLYAVFFFFTKPLHALSIKNKGMLILNLLLFVKYVVSIFIMAIVNDYGVPNYFVLSPKPETIELAIIYMIIEMASIFLTIGLFSNIFYKKFTQEKTVSCIEESEDRRLGIFIYLFLIASAILAIVYNESFLPGMIAGDNTLILNESDSHLLSLVFWSFKTILMCLLVDRSIRKYKKNNKMIYAMCAYVVVIVYVLLNISNSRINLILPMIMFFLITNEIFKRKGRIILACSLVLIMGIMFIVTTKKNQYLFTPSVTRKDEIASQLLSQTQEYTSNIRPIAYGLEAVNKYKDDITVSTFINDIAGSIPIVSHFVDQDDRINHYHNLYALGGKNESQIIPMVVSSKAYFSPFLSFLLTDLCIVLLMFFDGKYSNRKYANYLEAYMNLYLCFIFAYSIDGNLQMIVGRLFSRYLPVVIVYWLSKKIVVRRNHYRDEKQESTI